MYVVNEDKSIYATRGDMVWLAVSADNNGVPYVFQPGEIVRFRVFEKKGCHCVVLQKDFVLTEAVESVDIWLTKEETKFGDVISKPKDYWYEVELNPDSNPHTIVGYDDDGPKIFRLFPEGADTEGGAGEAPDEFVPGIDAGLNEDSERPVQNKAITGAINALAGRVTDLEQKGGGGSITVDDALSATSTNPVQNKVVTAKINEAFKEASGAANMVNAIAEDVVELYDRTNALETSIGYIADALDGIIAIQEELIGTITFSAGVNTHTALNGMTFGEWVNSPYNTIGAVVNDDKRIVYPDDGNSSLFDNDEGKYILSSDVIVDGYTDYDWV